jgi:ribosomal protein S18 acetylase RimI-like enzyme
MKMPQLLHRRADLERDGAALLELHCLGNYESETPWARLGPYPEYREGWLASPQPAQFLAELEASLRDARTVLDVWEVAGRVVGFLWLQFDDLPGFDVVLASVSDIAVDPEYHRRGIGGQILAYAEQAARQSGATLLRSEAGIENVASRALHERHGFGICRVILEKRLGVSPAASKENS